MKRKHKLVRAVGIALITVSVLAAAAGFFVVRIDIAALGRAGRENLLWNSTQVEIELLRFQSVLSDYSLGKEGVTPRQIEDRFDILWSRLAVVKQGALDERLAEYEQGDNTIHRLFQTLVAVDPTVVTIATADQSQITGVLNLLSPFVVETRNLSRLVLHGQEGRFAQERARLARNANILAGISTLVGMVSVAMMVYFAWESGVYRRLAEENRTLLAAATIASKAKSEFLAMMSHELRTPMNGVLGLLSLVGRQDLTRHQRRLMDRAETTGGQMVELLGDIQDFTDLQDNLLSLKNKPFSPGKLLRSVSEDFSPCAESQAVTLNTHLAPDCPKQLIGDIDRLRQALRHMAVYIQETAGVRNFQLSLAFSQGCLKVTFSFEYQSEGGEWRPNLIVGSAKSDGRTFAVEALGPSDSRGLIDLMGGTTTLDNPGGDRIDVQLSVPLEELQADPVLVRIATKSSALEAICRAALGHQKIQFLSAEDAREPHVVLIEAGGDKEPIQIKHYSRMYPQALLVALGRATNEADFDDFLAVPIDVNAIGQSKFMRLVS